MGQIIPAAQPGFAARVPITRRIDEGGIQGGATPAGADWRAASTPSDTHRAREAHPGTHGGAASAWRTASGHSHALNSGEWPARMRRASGATVGAIARVQVIVSLSWTVLALLIWYFALPTFARLTLLALCGALIAAGSALSMELARGARGPRLRVARALLPMVDLVAAAGAFWLLAGDSIALVLFLVPALLAAVLLGWRAGTLAAGASLLAVVGMWLALGAVGGWTSLVGMLVLALGLALVVGGAAAYARRVSGAQAELLARARQAEQHCEKIDGERSRLVDGLRLMEQAHRRLEQERAAMERQTGEMAHIVRRLADGDQLGAREQLARLMSASGPIGQALAHMAAGLGRLTLQEPTSAHLDTYLQEQGRQVHSVAHLLGEQAGLLNATDVALRDQAAVANQLVHAIQLLAHSAGSSVTLSDTDRLAVYQKMRDVEQIALGHASSTAMLGARMAQMRKRQGELDAQVRGLAGVVRSAGSGKLGRLGSVSQPGAVDTLGREANPSTPAPVSMPWVF